MRSRPGTRLRTHDPPEQQPGHVRRSGRLVARAGWLPITVRAGGKRVVAVGLGGVVVHRSQRGRSVGHWWSARRWTGMRRLGRPIGMLFCHEELVPYVLRRCAQS
ncbi:GNAT family N-acetyltransferase [Saccharopolyspora sp. ASAGF58]|uniref:GNAT family N-acetyltransferase n=1 Tax=Saccharopolyspora sp. ASAGF58 TaxID=2719023 RepID=UPI00143FBA3A|nr:GNAT family N-acetyltransferase [Saccharopolyspora sp. ASAGF58]